MSELLIVPAHIKKPEHLKLLITCLTTLRKTTDQQVLVIDDGSGYDYKKILELGFDNIEVYIKPENEGFSHTVNIGLKRALDEGQNAVLVNSDIEFEHEGWLEGLRESEGDIIGPMLVYPNRIIQSGGTYFCQPPSTKISTPDGFVNIEDLENGQGISSFSLPENRICHYKTSNRKGYKCTIQKQQFNGNLVRIETNKKSTLLTPNHKVIFGLNDRAKNGYGIYLMNRDNDWRVGSVKMTYADKFGPRSRMWKEKADKLWLLEICDTREEAFTREKIISATYGLPTFTFVAGYKGAYSQESLDFVWASIDVSKNALFLLEEYNLLLQYPLTQSGVIQRKSYNKLRGLTVAANLIPGFMQIPHDDNAKNGIYNIASWDNFIINKEQYNGKVYSIDVPPHHYYMADNIILHNSSITRNFDHRFKGAPEDLPAANVPFNCPVTAALHYIRHEVLDTIGLYDTDFKMSFEDVDFAIRAIFEGFVCHYNPAIRAIHHEHAFRGQASHKVKVWERDSLFHLMDKYKDTNFSGYVPTMMEHVI